MPADAYVGYEGYAPITGFVGSGGTWAVTQAVAPSTITVVVTPSDSNNCTTLWPFDATAYGVGVFTAPATPSTADTPRTIYFYVRASAP